LKTGDKNVFLNNSRNSLNSIFDIMNKLPSLKLKDLDSQTTAMIIVDMINGFVREGALKSNRVENLISDIVYLSKQCDATGIKKLAFSDSHPEDSPEFTAYPVHCLENTNEAEIVDEIKNAGGYELIRKNSTNGFHEPLFQEWMKRYPNVNTFIITGDCTDICIQQLAVTLKTWFNMNNLNSRIIIPAKLVDTYDLGTHNGDLMNVIALYTMMCNGIEIVKEIE